MEMGGDNIFQCGYLVMVLRNIFGSYREMLVSPPHRVGRHFTALTSSTPSTTLWGPVSSGTCI